MQKGGNLARRAAYLGVLTSIALVLGFIERYIPINASIPGVKLGLANIVILFAIYMLGYRPAFLVLIAKVLLSGFLFAGVAGLLDSLAGGLLSFAMMAIAFRLKRVSIVGVSVVGAVFHNIGQILIAALVVQNLKIAFYLPALLISGIVTGILTGIAGKLAADALRKNGMIPAIELKAKNAPAITEEK